MQAICVKIMENNIFLNLKCPIDPNFAKVVDITWLQLLINSGIKLWSGKRD